MSNRLANETSPYLLQHKDNPVDWYPWGNEAFERAKNEDKPIFLSIGYSSCHWCHVLAHESFEDKEIAELLNKYFISIKVDKEERPDIDSVYMAVCQAFTGSGGWPTSIFMTSEQKPFFAGTYFPKNSRGGMIGFRDLLIEIHKKWISDRDMLLQQSNGIVRRLKREEALADPDGIELAHLAAQQFGHIYDEKYGGFGRAPKFPTPHNLIFLLEYYERYRTTFCLKMADHTLVQMYRGGIFDHIGFGFCRYSTDRKFLVPHFEKMLYDNALLILAYCKGYRVTNKKLYIDIAEKTASYIFREMTSPEGGFYSSQDADSGGEEGKYYLFKPDEIISQLGKADGERFDLHFDITEEGNFEGKNIPNLLSSDFKDESFESLLSVIESYRKNRHHLHRDEKVLTAWNGLMIAAMCELYLSSKKGIYLLAAKNADSFIQKYLCENNTLYVSFNLERRGVRGFLDDYASYIFAQLSLYQATLEIEYLDRARLLCDEVISDFGDSGHGFYLYSDDHEELLLRPKETYDGAIPSGNSLMAYNLVRLSLYDGGDVYKTIKERQLEFLARNASQYPSNNSMFLIALLENSKVQMKITVTMDEKTEKKDLSLQLPHNAIINVLPASSKEFPLKNGKTTYYVCKGHTCLPPTNDLEQLI